MRSRHCDNAIYVYAAVHSPAKPQFRSGNEEGSLSRGYEAVDVPESTIPTMVDEPAWLIQGGRQSGGGVTAARRFRKKFDFNCPPMKGETRNDDYREQWRIKRSMSIPGSVRLIGSSGDSSTLSVVGDIGLAAITVVRNRYG